MRASLQYLHSGKSHNTVDVSSWLSHLHWISGLKEKKDAVSLHVRAGSSDSKHSLNSNGDKNANNPAKFSVDVEQASKFCPFGTLSHLMLASSAPTNCGKLPLTVLLTIVTVV